jgi:xylulose-5-phosphate/fructose-6-phosphate phosphoketolase
MLNRKDHIAQVFLPPDANTLLVTMKTCLEATDRINLVIASKHPLPQWLDMEQAKEHVARGASVWEWAGHGDDGRPDIVLASAGTIPTIELLATADLLREHVPDLKFRFVNVVNLFTLTTPSHHPSGLSQEMFRQLFTADRPVVFNFHGYPSAVHQLLHRRPKSERFHVRGYAEEGTTTTPFDLLAMNGVDRYQLAIEALSRVDVLAAEMLHGLSGEFAVRAVPDAERAMRMFREKLEEHRRYIHEEGDDPVEIMEWTWTGDGTNGARPS